MEPEKLQIMVAKDSVTGLLYRAPKSAGAKVTIVLGHGAGANQMSPFMRLFAAALAGRGFDTMTFNFLYTERGRRFPDPKAKLETCYRAVIEAALSQKSLKGNQLVIGGKSMGGRIASQIAAVDAKSIAGLLFLGYPLHAPGKSEQMRDTHLSEINRPMLFVQGSRDSLGSAEEIRGVIKKRRLNATLYEVADGDHSLKVPKVGKSGVSQEQIYEMAMNEIARWAKSL